MESVIWIVGSLVRGFVGSLVRWFVGSCIFFFVSSALAATPDKVLICDKCDTEQSFQAKAKHAAVAYSGYITVINTSTFQARAYRYEIPLDPVYNYRLEPRVFDIPLTAEVTNAIAGYQQLKAAFEAHRHAIGLAGMTQEKATGNGLSDHQWGRNILAHGEANGCGTPSGTWSYPVIPNFPFKSACDAHDICYTTNRSKASCDEEFLFNMQNLILPQVLDGWWTTITGKALLAALLANQAKIYYIAVTQLPCRDGCLLRGDTKCHRG